MSHAVVVLDISHYQDTPDFDALAAEGIVAICFKATEGTSYVDDTFRDRYNAAVDAGLGVFTYHFLKHGSIEAQMAHYLETVDPDWGERVVIDFEDSSCTLDDLEQAVQILFDDDRNLQVTVYGANGFLGAKLDGDENLLLAMTSLWVASYTTASTPTMSSLSGTWSTWTLWQFTDCASVCGFGPVDANRFNGSVEDCRSWVGPVAEGPQPLPVPEPLPEPVEPIVEVNLVKLVIDAGAVNIVVKKGALVSITYE